MKDPRKIVTEWWQPKSSFMDKKDTGTEQKSFAPKSSFMDKTPAKPTNGTTTPQLPQPKKDD